MGKILTSLGLMSGTSGDGVDASIIQSNGETKYEVIKDQYYILDGQHRVEMCINLCKEYHKYKS